MCFGWIDGQRKSIDDEAYKIRFTPRRDGSIWSAVNIRRAKELVELGLMMPSGLSQFEKRDEARTNRYAYERKNVTFAPAYIAVFKKNYKAWSFFDAQPAGYKHLMTHRVMSAKQEATRLRRLATLIEESAAGRRMDLLKPRR